jgi:molybdopterin converting factor small subunit
MSVTLKFSGQCRLAVNCDTKSVDVVEPTLLSELVTKQSLRSLLDSDGHLNSGILIFINNTQCTNTDTLMINDGDDITFMSPMSGG